MSEPNVTDEGVPVESDVDEKSLTRRSLLALVGGVGGAVGLGTGFVVFSPTPTLSTFAERPSNLVVGLRAETPEPVVIPGESIDVEVVYGGFRDWPLVGWVDAEEGAPEFDVTISARPAFAGDFEPVASGTLDAGTMPADTVSASVASDAFEQTNIDLAVHSAVSEDYAEFGPSSDGPARTDVDLAVAVESRSQDRSVSEIYTMTVVAMHLVELEITTGSLRERLDIDVDDGEIESVTIDGAETPVDVRYDSFGDDVADRGDEFEISLRIRPGFADDFETVASALLDSGAAPADSVSGIVHDGPIDIADHSAVSSDYSNFEPDDGEEADVSLDVEFRVESRTYGVSAAERIETRISITDEDEWVERRRETRVRRPRRPPPDAELAVGGRIALEGEAEDQPEDNS